MGINQYSRDPEAGTTLSPRPPPRTLQSALSRISLTSSDVMYPVELLNTTRGHEHHIREHQFLGLGRPLAPPRSSTTSISTLRDKPLPPISPNLEPQNGRTAWLHATAAFLVVFNCWGMANAYGLFQAYYESYYLPHTTPSAIAWIGSTQLALVFGLGVPVGRLVDKGYFRLMFHAGTLVMMIGIFATSWCKELWSLWLAQGLVTGLGMGMVFCSGIVALMTWFDERKIGIAMGLGAAGSCVGGIVYVLLARHFLISHGFATTMRILGGVAAATMIPPNLIFKMRRQAHWSSTSTPAVKGLKRRLTVLRTSLSTSYLLAASGMFFAFMGVYFGFVYMVSFASTVLKMSNTAATNLLIFMLAANLPGRFLPALISDKCIGPLNTIIPSIFLSAAAIGLWIASGEHNKGTLTVMACFYGFVSAGIQVLYAPAVYTFCLEPTAEAAGLDPLSRNESQASRLASNRMGLKAGGIFTCVGLACLLGTPIGGALISYRTDKALDHPYLGAQILAAASLLIGGCLLLGSRVARVGWEARRA